MNRQNLPVARTSRILLPIDKGPWYMRILPGPRLRPVRRRANSGPDARRVGTGRRSHCCSSPQCRGSCRPISGSPNVETGPSETARKLAWGSAPPGHALARKGPVTKGVGGSPAGRSRTGDEVFSLAPTRLGELHEPFGRLHCPHSLCRSVSKRSHASPASAEKQRRDSPVC